MICMAGRGPATAANGSVFSESNEVASVGGHPASDVTQGQTRQCRVES
jgi:hypothetical protein